MAMVAAQRSLATFFGGRGGAGGGGAHGLGCENQTEMAERLRVVSQQFATVTHLFGQQAQIGRATGRQPQDALGLPRTAGDGQRFGQPKCAE